MIRLVTDDLRPPTTPPKRHLLSVGDLTRDDVERLLGTARTFETSLERHVKKLPTLKGHLVVNLFYESSTRTSSSFELAAKRLSADTLTVKSVGSSVDKGESLKDTALTLGAYDPDVIVIRHPQIGAPQLVTRVTDAHVVNAGDGKHQHPTQALLDLYTLREEFGRLDGLHVAIVGDVLHSRVARSLLQAFALVGIRATLVGPPALLPRELPAETTTDIEAIRDADAVYVLRMQNERMEPGANFVPSLREYTARWGITPERLRPGQKVLHPGPMNRGVEIDSQVADSPDSLIVRQVRSGLVVRMAVLYDVLTGGPIGVQALAAAEGGVMLWQRELQGADLVIRGARILDPTEGIDARLEVRIDDGTIVEIAEHVDANEHRVVDADGLVLAPAFVDPHVHLRTPGREDEETVASGTAAAAAGGYCAILAMPNTDPVVDSAATLGALVEAARREADVPVGFLAAITRGQRGEELTEMGELAETGAVAFSDDGVPVASAGLMRRALQYASSTDRPLALHCEEPTLSRGGHVHEGRVAAELGFAGYPSVAESVAVERDLALAGYESGRVHVLHLSAAESVDALRRAREAGVSASGEATPHHLVLTDDAVRSLDPNVKMNPPLRAEQDRVALLEAVRDGTIEAIATDHAPHAAQEKEVPFEAAPFGVTGLETAFAALYTYLVRPGLLPLETLLERMSAGPARIFGLDRPRIATDARASLVLLDLDREWTVGQQPFRSRSGNSWLLGSTVKGAVRMTLAGGAVVHE